MSEEQDGWEWTGTEEFEEDVKKRARELDVEDEARAQRASRGAPEFKLVSFLDLLHMPALEWLIPGWLPRRCVGAVTGSKYLGKSTLMQLLAGVVGCEAGNFLGLEAEVHGTGLLILGEGQETMGQQARALLEVLHGEVPLIEAIMQPFPLTSIVAEKLAEAVKAAGFKPLLVVLDAKADFFVGEENSNTDAQNFVAGMKTIRDRLECACLVVTHPPRSDAQRDRGAQRLEDAMEVLWIVTDGVLTATKIKGAPLPEPISFALRGVEGTKGAMPFPLSEGEALGAASRSAQRQQDKALETVRANPGLGKAELLVCIRRECGVDQGGAAQLLACLLKDGRIAEVHGKRNKITHMVTESN
jgi:hypothetical protein